MPGSLGELDSLGLSGSEIRFHGKTLLALVEKAQTLPEEALPQPMLNLMDMPGYRKAFKAIKSLITDVSETHKISAELLASRRQINQLLNWHWKLKPQNNLPELISGWRGELMAEALHNLLQEYPRVKSSEAGLGALSATSGFGKLQIQHQAFTLRARTTDQHTLLAGTLFIAKILIPMVSFTFQYCRFAGSAYPFTT